MGDRTALTEFWEKQSHVPTVQTMMLNKFADKVDHQDRQDILESIPDFQDMNVVELGAGIGRFTTLLAKKAKHVTAMDIVESFTEENRKINGHMRNVSFKTGEASAFKIEDLSVDFVFSNWLLMYLTDIEVITLLKNVLTWLNVGGCFHLRESCSEPSKRKSSACTPLSQENQPSDFNPTHYRHICQYLDILQSIAIKDDAQDTWYKFEVVWSKSVDVYIDVYGNWRQVMTLVRKVALTNDEKEALEMDPSDDSVHLLKTMKNESILAQSKFDQFYDTKLKVINARSPASNYICKIIEETASKTKLLLNVVTDENFSASPFDLCQIGCKVYTIERSPNAFNLMLEKAVAMQDKRVRVNFVSDLSNRDWALPKTHFDIAIACCLLKEQNSIKILQNIKKLLSRNGRFIMLEEAISLDSVEQDLLKAGFNVDEIVDISVDMKQIMKEATSKWSEILPNLSTIFNKHATNGRRWFVITAS